MNASPEGDDTAYLESFWASFPAEKAASLQDRANTHSHLRNVQATLHSSVDRSRTTIKTLEQLTALADATGEVVLIVENIDFAWIARLGTIWDIPVRFFVDHASNPQASRIWRSVFETKEGAWTAREGGYAPWVPSVPKWSCWYVDGIWGMEQQHLAVSAPRQSNFLPRPRNVDDKYGFNGSTRISYWTEQWEDKRLCLVLVDAPYTFEQDSKSHLILRLPLSENRGGLVLPRASDERNHSLHDCLSRVLSHSWHFDYIFPGLFRIGSRSRALTVDCVTFFYLLAASTWETNMRLLDAHIKRTSFEDIRRPSTAVNDTLHDARHALTYLQDEVEKISRYMPMSVDRLLRDIGDPNGTPTRSAQSLYPRETLQDILRRANLLERFLMDSFNILVSSTGVVGTELSIAQGIRGQRLSTLAFVYVPLAFVTGIFGMNVAEINGSLLSVWVPVVVTLVIIVLTVAVFVMYSKWTESRWRSRWGGKTPERLSGGRL